LTSSALINKMDIEGFGSLGGWDKTATVFAVLQVWWVFLFISL